MASVAFPSWAYNSAGQAAVIVQSQAAFNALGGPGTWAFAPTPIATSTAPFDPGFQTTDIRLQQMLIELRVANQLAQFQQSLADDQATVIRADVLANDSSLVS